MQNTFTEWKNSSSTRTCQDCHYDGHKLLGNHTPERLKKDFSDIEYEFSDKGLLHISLRLKNNRAHILPTGDLFHSIQLEIGTDPNYKTIQSTTGKRITPSATIAFFSILENTML